MTHPIITQRKPTPLSYTQNGYSQSRTWDVIAVSELAALDVVFNEVGVQRGAPWRSHLSESPDGTFLCQSMSVETRQAAPVGGSGLYVVTANFAQEPNQGRPKAELGKPPVTWVESQSNTRTVDLDVEGRPITNYVEEPIDPPLTRLADTSVLVAEWIERAASQPTLHRKYLPYKLRCNETPWLGEPKGSWLCLGMVITPKEDKSEEKTFTVRARFEYKEPKSPRGISAFITRALTASGWTTLNAPIEGWADITIHKGRRRINPTFSLAPADIELDKRYLPILQKDANGNDVRNLQVTEPVPLTTQGQPLKKDVLPVALVIFHYLYKDFTPLGITA
jgi:hypothetical protein